VAKGVLSHQLLCSCNLISIDLKSLKDQRCWCHLAQGPFCIDELLTLFKELQEISEGTDIDVSGHR